MADAAADAEIVGVDHFAVGFDFLAFDADVGDPVLAAGIGATGDVEAEVFLIVGETIFELLGEPAGERLGFREREFAKFGAGASDGAANEGGRFDGKPGVGEFIDHCGDVSFGNVDEEEILHRRVADVAVAITLGEIGGEGELRGSDTSADYGSANGEKSGLLLWDDTEMIAVDLRGRSDGLGGIKGVAEFGFDELEERTGSPSVFEKEIFEAGFFAGVPENVGFAKDFGDGADDGDDLVLADEGGDGDGEVRLGGEATAKAEGEADFGSGEWRVASGEQQGRGVVGESKSCVGVGIEEGFLTPRTPFGMTGWGVVTTGAGGCD